MYPILLRTQEEVRHLRAGGIESASANAWPHVPQDIVEGGSDPSSALKVQTTDDLKAPVYWKMLLLVLKSLIRALPLVLLCFELR